VAAGAYHAHFVRTTRCAEILKLHGSVDWSLALGRKPPPAFGEPEYPLQFVRGKPDEALTCPDENIAIGTPGATKGNLANAQLAPLWNRAAEQIQVADAVVFVGYRFPPTDARAREHLLEAIEYNERPHVDLHVVLGPQRNEHVERLEEMLRYAAVRAKRQETPPGYNGGKSFRIVRHALWSQDFLQLVDRRGLIWRSHANPRWQGNGPPRED
jgi:hypothetical protein